jgi:hypothetical protein
VARTSYPALVVFDGYRGLHDGDRTAAASLKALLGCEDSTYWNNWSERGDSLKRRFDRASAWLEVRLGNITDINDVSCWRGRLVPAAGELNARLFGSVGLPRRSGVSEPTDLDEVR